MFICCSVGTDTVNVADYATLQEAADAATGKRLVFPAGQPYTTTGVTIRAGCYVEGNGSTLKFANNTTTIDKSDELLKVGGSGITIDGLNFDANSVNQSVWSQYRHGIRIEGPFDDVTVTNCDMVNLIGDGVYISTQTHGNIVVGPDNTFTANYDNRNGVAVVTGDTIEVHHNTFTHCAASGMPGPIDIEPNAFSDHLAHVDIHDNVLDGGSTAGTGALPAIVYGGFADAAVSDITIRGNDITGTRFTAGILVIGINGGPFNAATGIVIDGNNVHGIGSTGKIGVELDYWIGADVTNNTLNGMEIGVTNWRACLGASTGNTFIGVSTEIYVDDPHCASTAVTPATAILTLTGGVPMVSTWPLAVTPPAYTLALGGRPSLRLPFTLPAVVGTEFHPPIVHTRPAIGILSDTFISKDEGKWWWGSGASVISSQLNLPHTTSWSNNAIFSNGAYDLINSAVTVHAVTAPTTAGHYSLLILTSNADDYSVGSLQFYVYGTILYCVKIASGVETSTTLTYSPTDHAYWRIRADDNCHVYWDTSPDGSTWTNRWDWAATFDLTVLAAALIGVCDTGSGGVSIFDSFNVIP